MQSTKQSRIIEIHGRQTSAFSNQLRVRVLMACALEERSLSELQRRIEAPLAKLHYHVSRLLAAELLTVSRTQHRAGRAIRFYRAVGDGFIVPQEGLAPLPGDKLSAQLRRSLREEQGRIGVLSLLYMPAPEGGVLVKLLPTEPIALPRGLELWRIMNLSSRQRAALAKDLRELFERYTTAEPELGAELFLVHAAFGPQPPQA